jgi:hypothetical protein
LPLHPSVARQNALAASLPLPLTYVRRKRLARRGPATIAIATATFENSTRTRALLRVPGHRRYGEASIGRRLSALSFGMLLAFADNDGERRLLLLALNAVMIAGCGIVGYLCQTLPRLFGRCSWRSDRGDGGTRRT